jgi:predicted histone-like DNA-binding protein
MPVIYKSFQSVLANKEGKKLFYPRVVLTGNVDTEQVAKEIAELSSLSTGDSKNVIDNLVTVMTRHLQSSESVTLDGLGTFRLTMKSTMNGVEDPLKVSATQSTLRVRFLPTSKRNLDHTVSTRSLVTGVKCVRFDLQDTAGSGCGPAAVAQRWLGASFGMPSIGHSAVPTVERVNDSTCLRVPSGSLIHLP